MFVEYRTRSSSASPHLSLLDVGGGQVFIDPARTASYHGGFSDHIGPPLPRPGSRTTCRT